MAGGEHSAPSLLGKPPAVPPSNPFPFPPSLPRPSSSLNKSWANIVSSSSSPEIPVSPLLKKEQFDRLKNSVNDFVQIDPEFHFSMVERMQGAAYAKFLGKALPLEHLKSALLDAWKGYGSFSIADMPNGFYFIRCENAEMLSSIIFDGPWTFGGMVLQMSPWKPNFQPSFEQLSSAAVWIQLHNLPMELWHADLLESIAAPIGRLLKIDDATLNGSRAKFARLCLEIDLSVPLKQGFWLGFGSREAFATIQYERLPVFCFHCGKIGHGSSACPSFVSSSVHCEAPSLTVPAVQSESEHSMHLGEANVGVLPAPVATSPPSGVLGASDDCSENFGPWMLVQRRRGRGSGGGRSGHSRSRPSLPTVVSSDSSALIDRHVDSLHATVSPRGRGGRLSDSRPFPRSSRGGRGSSHYFSDNLEEWNYDRSDFVENFPNSNLEVSGVSGPLDIDMASADLNQLPLRVSPEADGCLRGKQTSPLPLSPVQPVPSAHPSLLPSQNPLSSSQISSSPRIPPFSPPILLSSLGALSHSLDSRDPLKSVENPSSESEAHLALVSKVVAALCPSHGISSPAVGDGDNLMEEEVLSESSDDREVDMSIDQTLSVSNAEATARRDSSHPGASRKKGRKIVIS